MREAVYEENFIRSVIITYCVGNRFSGEEMIYIRGNQEKVADL